MKRDGLKIEGHIGKWCVIDETVWNGEKVYLLEREIYGYEAACLIVNEKLEIILDGVWNGFADLEDIE